VSLVRIEFSEKRIASINRLERIRELGITLDVTGTEKHFSVEIKFPKRCDFYPFRIQDDW
jgi:hypothetical protein